MRVRFRIRCLVLLASIAVANALLAGAGRVTGRVANNSESLANVSVEVLSLRQKVRSTPEGYYVLLYVPPGSDTIRFTGAGYRIPDVPVKVVADATTVVNVKRDSTGITISCYCPVNHPSSIATRPVRGKATLSGRIVDAKSSRPLGYSVQVNARRSYRDTDGIHWIIGGLFTVTDEEGRYAFNNLDPGEYEFYFPDGDVTPEPEYSARIQVQLVADSVHVTNIPATRSPAYRAQPGGGGINNRR